MPEWKEPFEINRAIPGELDAISQDAWYSLERREDKWSPSLSAWIEFYTEEALENSAKQGNRMKRMLSGVAREMSHPEAEDEDQRMDLTSDSLWE